MDEKRFAKMLEDWNSLTAEQKQALRDALEIPKVAAKVSSGIRVSGKVMRTEKVLEEKTAKQMQILIDVLPKDRAIDIVEWGTLAVAGGLQTQQPPERIAAYYKKAIIDGAYAVVIG
jgi:selenophosphate synthetase-related protein